MKKYKLTDDTKLVFGRTLHRIVALRDFGNVKKGDKGGWIEKEDNLSHEGSCWVYDNAQVFDNAQVSDNSYVGGNAQICDNSKVYNNSHVCNNSTVSGNSHVCGNAQICCDTKISDKADYIVFKNWWSSGRYFTWTRSNNMWSVGCFHGTGDKLIKKAYADSEDKGKHYEEIVEYVNKCVLGK